ncbi:hypothetical protein HZA97_06075 [Candidatus Woesearchaeota archaeon]|nr:hypothetical protein [Candidatus Woesearchaeota archaeon]
MELLALLAEVGFTERESKVYLALTELGSTTTGPLIKKSGVPNSKIYEILESLQTKGFTSWIIKGKTKYFQASEPKKILELFKAKEKQIEEEIPRLEALQIHSKERSNIELFEGLPAIRSMLLNLVSNAKKGEHWYGFGTGATSKDLIVAEFYEWWGPAKITAGIHDHTLLSLKNKKLIEETHTVFKKPQTIKAYKKLWEFRYSDVSFPGDMAIFRNQVVILSWQETPIGILITNKKMAEQYKEFFLKEWKTAK